MPTATTPSDSQSTKVCCAHCGLPAPPPPADSELSFCCRGCRGAYDLIRGWGLEEYYDLRDASGSDLQVDDASVSFADFDDPSLLGRSAPFPIDSDRGGRLFKSRLSISGLHCVACVWLIERACERVAGWHSTHVNMNSRTIEVVFDPASVRLSQIGQYLYRLGYRISILQPEQIDPQHDDDNVRMLIDIAVAGFCAANAMWIAIALYAGQFSGIAASHSQFLRIAGVVLGSLAVVFPGRVFFRSAWASWRTRTPHMDLPVAVGLTAGLAGSIHGLFDSAGDVYFDSIACLVFFLLVGRWIQMRQQRRAGEAVTELIRISPTAANRVDDSGNVTRISVDSISIGEMIRVHPGESIPIDGVVVSGASSVDRSLLTGESRPIEVQQGTAVEAGTENLQADLTIRATAAAADTRFAELTRAVAEAAGSRTPIVQLANRIGGWFVMVVFVLAAITAVIWMQIDPSRVTSNVVALLIVACPCALALATPLALAIAIGRLARSGILIRDGDCLERIDRGGTILFDKTGTLTEGRMRVIDWHGDRQVLEAAAAIEAKIHHPIAHAVCQYARQQGITAGDAQQVQQQVGSNVSGWFGGRHYVIGGWNQVAEVAQSPAGPAWQDRAAAIIDAGASPIAVVGEGKLVAVFGVADPLREGADDVTGYFASHRWRVGMLSGDNQMTVDRVGKSLGMDPEMVAGGMLPNQKLERIESAARTDGPVVMVGDGVNDAAALAAADVGIAIGGGAAASLHAAPVMIADGQLGKITMLMDAAIRTRRNIHRNFAVSIGYNLLAVMLAMTGTITPLVAALLMPISSVSVLALTLSRRTLGGPSP